MNLVLITLLTISHLTLAAENCSKILENFCFDDDWTSAAAHGTHAMDLFELKYFFDPNATEVNNVPVGNKNFSSNDLVLAHAPNLHANNSFKTPAMHSVDLILTNWDDDNFVSRGATVLEKLVHNLHMYESLSVAGKMYQRFKKNREKNAMTKFCPCILGRQDDVVRGIRDIVGTFATSGNRAGSWRWKDYFWKEMMKRRNTGSDDSSKCNKRKANFGVSPATPVPEDIPLPSLINATIWAVWKPRMLIPMGDIWNYQLAHYIYCRLNM